MDTGPSQSDSAMLDPSQTGPTSDATRDMVKAVIMSPELRRSHAQKEGSRIYTAFFGESTRLSLPIKDAPSAGLNCLEEPEGGLGLLVVADSAKYVPKDDRISHSVGSFSIYDALDATASYPVNNTAMNHQCLSEDLDHDSASVQTFQSAPTTIQTYVTAQSVVDYERWQEGPFVQEPGNNYPAYRERSHKCIQAAFRVEPTFESLVSAVVTTLEVDTRQRASQSLQTIIREGLLLLCDPSHMTLSLNEVTGDLLSRVEQNCSSYNETLYQQHFADRTEEFIWEYAVLQPNLHTIARKSLSAFKTFDSQWLKLLSTHGLILEPEEALDWSGRGQHVQYAPEEEASIPLESRGNLGFGASGLVDRVRCRRIDLARKTIQCTRNLTREEAAKEVAHLQRLQHQHIVRLVGTYTLKKKLSILVYPATGYNLAEFLDQAHDDLTHDDLTSLKPWWWLSFHQSQASSYLMLFRIMGCLVHALKFIHGQSTKHMDIKPTNILVDHSYIKRTTRVYITDFGVSRSYQSMEASFTDSPISYTRIYAAPEVTQQITRGPPADIFSLGCVFMEIMATLLSTREDSQQERLRQIRNEGADVSYQANIENIIEWYEVQREAAASHPFFVPQELPSRTWLANLLPTMLAASPEARPTAAELSHCGDLYHCGACDSGPEPFSAA